MSHPAEESPELPVLTDLVQQIAAPDHERKHLDHLDVGLVWNVGEFQVHQITQRL